jgi:ribonuclease HI
METTPPNLFGAVTPDLRISTDGACLDNPGGAGGWAAVIQDGETTVEKSGPEEYTTNNRMELTAILVALRFCSDGDAVTIRSDSTYALNVASGEWKARKNRDLVEPIREETERLNVRFEHVQGHNGDPDNERADTLAREAAQKG